MQVENNWYAIEYEGLHLVCFGRGIYGHNRNGCPYEIRVHDGTQRPMEGESISHKEPLGVDTLMLGLLLALRMLMQLPLRIQVISVLGTWLNPLEKKEKKKRSLHMLMARSMLPNQNLGPDLILCIHKMR